MKWLLNIIYLTLLTLLSPVILWRCVRHGRYRQGWKQKLLGHLPERQNGQRIVWFHAVSVGEVLQLQKVVETYRRAVGDEVTVLITTSTDTGYELAANRFSDCLVSWFPLDFSWAVNNALRRVQPELVVLVELELWPNFLMACRQNDVRTALINARMSDKSFRGYQRIRGLVAPLFEHFSVVAVQTAEYAHRLIQLGTRESVTAVTGSVKFDGVLCDRANPATQTMRNLLQIAHDDLVFLAGSTQEPEEQLAIDTWKSLRLQHPNLRLILVPRHRERFDAVGSAVLASGCQLTRRSKLSPGETVTRDSVILLDTIGELSGCWGLADIAFVGGSFGARGGQNMLEPAAFGAAVLFGPNTWNFKEIVAQLLRADAAVRLESPAQLLTVVSELLNDSVRRTLLGQTAQQVILSQQGAIERTVRLLTMSSDASPQTLVSYPQHKAAA